MIEKLPYPIKHKVQILLSNRRIKRSPLVLNLSPEAIKWKKLNKILIKRI